MIDPKQFREYIVAPALLDINLWSLAAEDLVMGTALQESRLTYLHQLGKGPALGLFQMEPATYSDLRHNYLVYVPKLAGQILDAIKAGEFPDPDRLMWDLKFAAIMCRVHYRRIKEALPTHGDVDGYARYWKKYYNTPLGAGTEKEFKESYLKWGVP